MPQRSPPPASSHAPRRGLTLVWQHPPPAWLGYVLAQQAPLLLAEAASQPFGTPHQSPPRGVARVPAAAGMRPAPRRSRESSQRSIYPAHLGQYASLPSIRYPPPYGQLGPA